jgi:hypothetical protein
MGSDSRIEVRSRANQTRGSRLRIEWLMAWVAVIAVVSGWIVHVNRMDRSFQEDRSQFIGWAAEFEKDQPSLRPLDRSMTTSGIFFWADHRWNQDDKTPTGERISIQVALQAGPAWADRRVTFESPGRTVTWPFADIERGRRIDLKAEFPEAFRRGVDYRGTRPPGQPTGRHPGAFRSEGGSREVRPHESRQTKRDPRASTPPTSKGRRPSIRTPGTMRCLTNSSTIGPGLEPTGGPSSDDAAGGVRPSRRRK